MKESLREKYDRAHKRSLKERALLIGGFVMLALKIAFWMAVIFVAQHFVSKYW